MAKKPKVLPPLQWLAPRVRVTRVLSLATFVGLIVLLTVNNLWFADLHGARTGVILAIELVPLLLVLPGMLMGSARAHAWTCFVVNLYFIKGVLAAFDPALTNASTAPASSCSRATRPPATSWTAWTPPGPASPAAPRSSRSATTPSPGSTPPTPPPACRRWPSMPIP